MRTTLYEQIRSIDSLSFLWIFPQIRQGKGKKASDLFDKVRIILSPKYKGNTGEKMSIDVKILKNILALRIEKNLLNMTMPNIKNQR